MALAALDELTAQARLAPIERSLPLKALLALLYSMGDRRDRECYKLYLDACSGASDRGEHADTIIRGTNSKTHWYGIVRSLGYEPGDQSLNEAVAREQVIARDGPEALDRSIHWASIAMKEQIWSREIVATRGRPVSPGAKQLMAERIARGEPVDGGRSSNR
jgi:hypothetical protein